MVNIRDSATWTNALHWNFFNLSFVQEINLNLFLIGCQLCKLLSDGYDLWWGVGVECSFYCMDASRLTIIQKVSLVSILMNNCKLKKKYFSCKRPIVRLYCSDKTNWVYNYTNLERAIYHSATYLTVQNYIDISILSLTKLRRYPYLYHHSVWHLLLRNPKWICEL